MCRLATEARACTGVLGIHPLARDIKIDNFSVTFYGTELLQDTKLELSVGNRWATLLSSILSTLPSHQVRVDGSKRVR